MDREQEEMQSLGLFGFLYEEASKITLSWRKILTQITLKLIIPLSFIFLIHIEVSNLFFYSSSYINTPYKLLSYINILNTSISLNKTHLHISYSSSPHNLLLENWAKQRKSIEIKIKILTITITVFSVTMLPSFQVRVSI